MRGPVEPEQYTSSEYTQTLDDHLVLASIGTVGDALDNALAESFVDSYKTELIADRVWRNQTQLELATVAWVAWFNHDRLHSSLGDIPPVEFERNYYAATALNASTPANGSVMPLPANAANGLTTRHLAPTGVDFAANGQISPATALVVPTGIRSGRDNAGQGPNGRGWPLRRVVEETDILTDTDFKTATSTTDKPT